MVCVLVARLFILLLECLLHVCFVVWVFGMMAISDFQLFGCDRFFALAGRKKTGLWATLLDAGE